MARGGRVLRSVEAPAVTGPGFRASRSAPTLVYRTDPHMRSAAEAKASARPRFDDIDEVIGASRWSQARFRLWRLARRRRLGLALTAALYSGTAALGVIDGGHWPTVRDELLNAHVTAANVLGFRLVAVQTEGQNALTDDEVLLALGVRDDTALPFLDVRAARDRLMANPLVEDATVKKLYPDRLTVTLTERKPFALWQHDGKVQILAEDGTPIDDFRDSRFAHLPLVVGPAANAKAEKLLEALASAPKIREATYAAVLVAERRWNLRLRSGVEVKLPEIDFAGAIARLERLQARNNLFAKWISIVDLRAPGKVVVKLSPEAAAMAEEADKAAAKTRKKAGQT